MKGSANLKHVTAALLRQSEAAQLVLLCRKALGRESLGDAEAARRRAKARHGEGAWPLGVARSGIQAALGLCLLLGLGLRLRLCLLQLLELLLLLILLLLQLQLGLLCLQASN